MTPNICVVLPKRKRRFATDGHSSAFDSVQPRKIGKNIKGLKIKIRSGSLKATQPIKATLKIPSSAPGLPESQTSTTQSAGQSAGDKYKPLQFNFDLNELNSQQYSNQFNSQKIMESTQQSSNFSHFVQNSLPITKTDDAQTTARLCSLFSSIL